MIDLTEEEALFKLSLHSKDSRNFFSTHPAKEWDIETYFAAWTKQSKTKTIFHNYDNDLNWIANLNDVPPRIKEYARELINVKKVRATVSLLFLKDTDIVVANARILEG